jgi:hypothetical protein
MRNFTQYNSLSFGNNDKWWLLICVWGASLHFFSLCSVGVKQRDERLGFGNGWRGMNECCVFYTKRIGRKVCVSTKKSKSKLFLWRVVWFSRFFIFKIKIKNEMVRFGFGLFFFVDWDLNMAVNSALPSPSN